MARKELVGRVVSTKMQKTAVVLVETLREHPRFHRVVRSRSKLYAHAEEGACALGDVVRVQETRPLSKTKRWRILEVIQKGAVPEVKPIEIDQALLEPAREPKGEPEA